eukprot:216389_1
MALQQSDKRQLQLKAEEERAIVRQDYLFMSNVINGLHKDYKETREDASEGRYVVSMDKYERWAQATSRRICPAKDKQQEVLDVLLQLQWADKGAESIESIQMNYTCGGRSTVACCMLLAKDLGNDKIGVIYGIYRYSWKEQDTWKLNCRYWETQDKKSKLKNWLKFRSIGRVIQAIKYG